MTAVIFGSLSTVADTSELQRKAFNDAFAKHGLAWRWEPEPYQAMLRTSGGEDRISQYAHAQGQTVDAAAVHRTKSEAFQAGLAASELQPREGVLDTIREAKRAGIKVAFVTTTSPENVSALLAALSPALSADDFDLVLDSASAQPAKPDPASYRKALEVLGEQAGDCIAIEDNLDGVRAAVAAGLRCVAFPNSNTATQHFPTAQRRVDVLDFPSLHELLLA